MQESHSNVTTEVGDPNAVCGEFNCKTQQTDNSIGRQGSWSGLRKRRGRKAGESVLSTHKRRRARILGECEGQLGRGWRGKGD